MTIPAAGTSGQKMPARPGLLVYLFQQRLREENAVLRRQAADLVRHNEYLRMMLEIAGSRSDTPGTTQSHGFPDCVGNDAEPCH